MANTTHKRQWVAPLIACTLLVGGAAWASTLLPDPHAAPSVPKTATTAFAVQRLGVWDGKVARFDEDAPSPVQIYDVAVASLPEEIRQALERGVTLSSEAELTEWLDNLTS